MTPSVLIVDDEENLRLTLSRILGKAGYSVTTAASGEEALRLSQAGAYDLAFIDLLMPGIGGVELLVEFRKRLPDMPVVILTAHATLESAIEAVRRGAREYLLKPADPKLILELVETILNEQKAPQRQREILSEIQLLVSELHQVEKGKTEEGVKAPIPTEPTRYLKKGPFVLDLFSRQVTLDGGVIELSPTNFDYLVTLVRHSPDPVPYPVLVRESQGYEVDRHEAREMSRWRIHELRKSIEEDSRSPKYILTVRNLGYRLVVSGY